MDSASPGLPDVSRETTERLKSFADAVAHWTRSINLISERTTDEIWARHILDSLQVMALAPKNAMSWCDLGSGAGFPGLVAAIVNLENNPTCVHTLIESDKRKSAFLALQSRALALNARIIAGRIESTPPVHADVITARALAPLPKLLAYASRHGSERATYIFPKGRGAQTEIAEARAEFDFDAVCHPSKTDPQGAVVVIANLMPRRARA